MTRKRSIHSGTILAVVLSLLFTARASANRRVVVGQNAGQKAVAAPPGIIPGLPSLVGNESLTAPGLGNGVLPGLKPLALPVAPTLEAPQRQAPLSRIIASPQAAQQPAPQAAAETEKIAERRRTFSNTLTRIKGDHSEAAAATSEASPDAAFAALSRMGVLFDGGKARTPAGNAADAPVPASSRPEDARRAADWRPADDSFRRQPPAEELIRKLGLDPHHRDWLTDMIFGDRLTGLKNAIYLREKQDEIVLGNNAIITIKLDWLKEINDGVSHAAGDAFLKGFGIIGKKIVGKEAIVVRRSPTGFAVFVKGEPEKARLIAHAIRLGIERELSTGKSLASALSSKEPVGTTISAGIAELVKDAVENGATNGGMTAQEAYKRAYRKSEEARMKAKDEAGGNRVAVHDGDSVRFDEQMTIEELRRRFAELEMEVWPHSDADIGVLDYEPDRRGDAIPGDTILEKLFFIVPDPELHPTVNMLMRKVYNNPLSGLHNRRWFDDNLKDVLGFFTEIHALDIDKFGDVNKIVGENNADRALRVLGGMLHEQTRGKPAIALHLSGEEFYLLTRMGPREAASFAHQVRRNVARNLGPRSNLRDPKTGAALKPTISVGIAPIPTDDDLAATEIRDRILEESEEALKTSKNRGRNWVSHFGEPAGLLDRAINAVSHLKEKAARVPRVGRWLASRVTALGEALRRLR